MIVWNEFRNDARVLKEAESLAAAGHRVIVHALHVPGVTREREVISSGIEVVRVARSPFWRFRGPGDSGGVLSAVGGGRIVRIGSFSQALRIAARAWAHLLLLWRMVLLRADVVHAHDVNTLPTAWLAARMSGARLVYDAHEISTSREGYSSFKAVVAWVERTLMPRADATITTTTLRAKFFARAYGVARPLVLQNRPRLQRFKRTQRIREELQLVESWPVILYQGGLQPGRGLAELVRLAGDVPDAYFVFIGGGSMADSLRKLAESLGVSDRVRFIPTVSLADLPSYTASADIGVQPIENTCLNHYTTDSNKLFEYVQAGLPIVTSDLPEIRRIVRHWQVGVLVAPSDWPSMGHALRSLVADASARHYYSQNCLAAAAALSWETQESELLTLYRGLGL
jgi:glycosyltransferase involved in cell wall biosynthesis